MRRFFFVSKSLFPVSPPCIHVPGYCHNKKEAFLIGVYGDQSPLIFLFIIRHGGPWKVHVGFGAVVPLPPLPLFPVVAPRLESLSFSAWASRDLPVWARTARAARTMLGQGRLGISHMMAASTEPTTLTATKAADQATQVEPCWLRARTWGGVPQSQADQPYGECRHPRTGSIGRHTVPSH